MTSEARVARPFGRVVIGANALAQTTASGVGAVLSFGLCGALDPALHPGDLAIGLEVRVAGETFAADPAWVAALRSAFPGATVAPFADAERIVASRADKAALATTSGAMAVDMESFAVAKWAARAKIPFAILRAVSDGMSDELPPSAQAGFRADGTTDIAAVIRRLIARPSELPGLIRTARNAAAGFAALKSAASVWPWAVRV